MTLKALIERVEAATEGSLELDVEIAVKGLGGIAGYFEEDPEDECWFPPGKIDPQKLPRFTTSLDAALTLRPSTACNFYLCDFIGHGMEGWRRTAWACSFNDSTQLVGEEEAGKEIERIIRSFPLMAKTTRGPMKTEWVKSIAEHFREFHCMCAATPALAVTSTCLKARESG